MANWYMLTLIGRDRPGIVAQVTTALYQAGANLGETSMLRLGNSFTVMMMVDSGNGPDALRQALAPAMDALGLALHIDAIDGELHRRPVPDVTIRVHGADRAGIVAQVTSRAAAAGLNIVDLESDVGGSESKPIYIMQIQGTASQGIEAIEAALADLQAEGVKVDVSPVDTLIG